MKTITLSDGREITIREFKVKDIKAALKKEDEIDRSIALISFSSGLSINEVEELPYSDYLLIEREINGFLEK